jgi:hypothetical protein
VTLTIDFGWCGTWRSPPYRAIDSNATGLSRQVGWCYRALKGTGPAPLFLTLLSPHCAEHSWGACEGPFSLLSFFHFVWVFDQVWFRLLDCSGIVQEVTLTHPLMFMYSVHVPAQVWLTLLCSILAVLWFTASWYFSLVYTAEALFSSSLKLYTISHRMFGHMHEVLNVD